MGRILNWLLDREVEPERKQYAISQASPEVMEAIKFGQLGTLYERIYQTQPSVYTVVEFLAWQIAGVGLKFFARESDTERTSLSESPLAELFKAPAPGITYEWLIHALVVDLGVWGNAYWLKQTVGGEKALVPLPPRAVTPRGGTVYAAATYDYSLNGNRRTFDAEEIVHFRRYNPMDPRIGMSPLEPLRFILLEEEEASRARQDMWRNQARVPGWIGRPSDAPFWDDDQFARFRADWQNVHSGRGNTGKTAILPDGMEFHEASWSPKEAEFIEGRKLTLETVCRAYNVPVSVLSMTETATYASQKEFHQALYQDTLGPWFRMLEGVIDADVVPWLSSDPNVYSEFNMAEKLRGSFEDQIEAYSKAAGPGVAWLSVNRIRAIQNEPPIGDPDDPENVFNFPVRPTNVTYGNPEQPQLAPRPAQTPAEPPAEEATVVPIRGQ